MTRISTHKPQRKTLCVCTQSLTSSLVRGPAHKAWEPAAQLTGAKLDRGVAGGGESAHPLPNPCGLPVWGSVPVQPTCPCGGAAACEA